MTWNQTVINGSNSVSANKTQLNQNSSYITSKVAINHFWNGNFVDNGSTVARSGLDGFHSHIEMPAFENPSGTSVDPTRSANIDGMLYYKKETVRQNNSSTGTEVIALADNARQGKGAVLVAHAYCEYAGTTSNGVVGNSNINSHFGIQESAGDLQITRTALGKYTINFASSAPSENYIIFGSGFSSGDLIYLTSDQASAKTTASVKITFVDRDGNKKDPSSAMVVVLANG